MKPVVHVIDYGMGNLFSVTKALENRGAQVVLSSSVKEFSNAQRVVLPGVGAFEDGMKGLREKGFVEFLRAYGKNGGKLLGICLGMQMLLETGEEFGQHEGLGLVPGRVSAIPFNGVGKTRKIPHVGWNALQESVAWKGTLLDGVTPGESMYFVHSFTALPTDDKYRLADCDYEGYRVSAVVRNGNIYGCQFHPEKSGKTGLKIIERFLTL